MSIKRHQNLCLADRHVHRYSAARKVLTLREKTLRKRLDLEDDVERSARSKDRWKNFLNEVKIYHIVHLQHFTRFHREHQLDAMPLEDVLQEIRLAMLETASCEYDAKENKLCCAYDSAVLKQTIKNLRSLIRKTDYAEKDGKLLCSYTKCDLEQLHSSSAIERADDFPLANKILDYYETHTVKETCAEFGIEYTDNIQKRFNEFFPKHAAHGGHRRGKATGFAKEKCFCEICGNENQATFSDRKYKSLRCKRCNAQTIHRKAERKLNSHVIESSTFENACEAR